MKKYAVFLILIFLLNAATAHAQEGFTVGVVLKMMGMKFEQIEKMVLNRSYKVEKDKKGTVSRDTKWTKITQDGEDEVKRAFTCYDVNVSGMHERFLKYNTSSRKEYDALVEWAKANKFEEVPGARGGQLYVKGKEKFTLSVDDGRIGGVFTLIVDNWKSGIR